MAHSYLGSRDCLRESLVARNWLLNQVITLRNLRMRRNNIQQRSQVIVMLKVSNRVVKWRKWNKVIRGCDDLICLTYTANNILIKPLTALKPQPLAPQSFPPGGQVVCTVEVSMPRVKLTFSRCRQTHSLSTMERARSTRSQLCDPRALSAWTKPLTHFPEAPSDPRSPKNHLRRRGSLWRKGKTSLHWLSWCGLRAVSQQQGRALFYLLRLHPM